MSSSFKYTLTKLRSMFCSLKRCLRSAVCVEVSESNASPAVFASTTICDWPAANCRKGAGMVIVTGICLPLTCAWFISRKDAKAQRRQSVNCLEELFAYAKLSLRLCAFAGNSSYLNHLNLLLIKTRTVGLLLPRKEIARLALARGDDDV